MTHNDNGAPQMSDAAADQIVKIEHAEFPEAKPPQQTGPAKLIDAGPDLAGKPCFTCGDEPQSKPFAEGEALVLIPTDQGEIHQHALCFYIQRCVNLEAMLKEREEFIVARGEEMKRTIQLLQATTEGQRATHQTLCAVVGKTGRITLHQHNFERAILAGCKLKIETKDGATTIALERPLIATPEEAAMEAKTGPKLVGG